MTTKIDFRKICRGSDRVESFIRISNYGGSDIAITTGRISVRFPERRAARTILSAKYSGSEVDCDHDTPQIFQIPIVNFQISFIEDSGFNAEGLILPSRGAGVDKLRLNLDPNYSPANNSESGYCELCKNSHGWVRSFLPEEDEKLSELLFGAKISITTMPLWKDHE